METNIKIEETTSQNFLNKSLWEWQNKLLPLMKRMIILFSVFFCITTLGQLIYLQRSILTAPTVLMDQPLSMLKLSDTFNTEERQTTAKLEALILLESSAMDRRYHQANVQLMSNMWVRYLGFVTGMILAMVGSIFILGKLELNTTSEIAGKTSQAEFNLKSSSPGIILVVLGTALMITTITLERRIQVTDAPVYLQPSDNNFAPKVKPVNTEALDSIAETLHKPLTQFNLSKIQSKLNSDSHNIIKVKPTIIIPQSKDTSNYH